ncbi:transcription factor MYB3R-1 isoform X2 [Capsella rubella]|uniref:transcription factor MYB3R-1 isoform X2 n=1 Tax=Capsella rubella TaxID=81985 RepID=UPI000CD58CCE|nr:transcription factor MYB3R-1 isoform X2 [Capsella rubella]
MAKGLEPRACQRTVVERGDLEDNTIIALVERYGAKKWSTISQHLPGRIGKQCRERWHNHLNPLINKNAWTQEEELTLIRAHQIYGNKWAELMKLLPGRSDNSIKNHWNSSVKKKLDSYYASGLLDQCQSSPLIALQNKSIASSSSWMYSSGDEGNSRAGVDAEESECSQASTVFSQSTNDLQEEVKPGNEEFYMPEFHSRAEHQISNDAEPYYPSFEEVKIVVPEISCEAECSKKFQNLTCSHEVRTTTATEDQLQGMSNEAKQDPDLDLLTDNMDNDGKNQAHRQAFQSSGRLSEQPSLPNSDTDPEAQTLITDEECCRVLFPDTMKDSCTSSIKQGRNMIDPRKGKGCLCSQSVESHAHETGKLPALSRHPSSSEVQAGHNCVPLSDSDLKDPVLLRNDSNPPIQGSHLFGATELECKTVTNDSFIDTDGHVTSHGNDNDGIEQHGLSYIPKDSLKLVPLNSFSSPSRVNRIYFPIDDKPAEKDKGALCYEPPRFPSADIPFFSCDLVPSNSDLRQEYSPFGIRQLMISSMNCTTPLRLWDSPCHERSPDVMLNDATKSLSNAPSILKKRHRDLLSPVLDRRKDKKLKRAATSSLAKDLSCLDVMLDGGDDCMSTRPSESPENKNRHASPSKAKDNRYSASGWSDQEMIPIDEEPKETLKLGGVTSMQNQKGCNEGGASAKNDQETSGTFVEIQLCSPGMTGGRSDNKVNTSAKDLSNQHKRSLADIPTEEISPELPCTVDSSPLSAIDKTNTTETSFDIENFNIFDGTPYRKLLDTPSPWKSPLLFGSFLQSPKLPPEVTFEDIGCFMSPGERSYDAIGLMKHLSEHSATAYADALEVLGNDTPETILKKRQLNKSIQGKENQHHPHDQLGNRSQVERRTLDFSDCGTPGKSTVSSAPPGGYSSPSSYLLKSCR